MARAAAVILPRELDIPGLNDSKKLTEKRRDALYEEITKRALAYKIIFISPQEIDERNILWATMDGMAQAVAVALDSVKREGVVGTIAGDDTVFVLLRTETLAREFALFFGSSAGKGGF